MRYYTPKSELDARITRFQIGLREQDVECALITQNVDMFYFSGTIQHAHLFIPAEGKPVLFVTKSTERARSESFLDCIVDLAQPKDLRGILSEFGYGSLKTIGLEGDVLPFNLYRRYEKLFSPAKAVDISPLIRSVRMIKSPYELELIREAGKMGSEIMAFVSENLRAGMAEFQIVGMIEKLSREKGHPGFIRTRGFNQDLVPVLLLSGPGGGVPSYANGPLGGSGATTAFPYGPCNRIIGRDESVIVDYEAWVGGYMTDMTRTFCVGRLPGYMERAYHVAVEIQELLKDLGKPGIKCEELFQKAREKVRKYGLIDHFMGMHRPVSFIGHGVGLEVDELPVIAPGIATQLVEGMVIAIEPKFVFPKGAVGIENTFVVGKQGLEHLTSFDEGIQYC
ncbi:MAG: M24 family metallopeptidase [Bacillota bacterium]